MGTTVTELLTAFGLLDGETDSADGEMVALIEEWRDFFEDTSAEVSIDVALLRANVDALFAAPTRARELELLAEGCENPLVGMAMVIAALPGTAFRQADRWWSMFFSEQTGTGFTEGWNIKDDFPAPGDGTRYLIISDLHRDATSDDRGPLNTGSIDHFSSNAALYERILDWVIAEDYTLLEGGDCEELWFVRALSGPDPYPRNSTTGRLDPAARLQEIITSHSGVYDRLKQLHLNGRYFRIYGNHDSFLKPDGADHSVEAVLKGRMEAPGKPFEIYDAFVIPGVKTMMDHTAGDILGDVAALAGGTQTADQFLQNLMRGRLGLDSADYVERCSMFVTHGHQFDFWNCPQNEILGLLIANTVGMFVDRNMDPLVDLGGIALQGNPLIDFNSIFATLPIFNSWLNRGSAVQFAHQVQHTPNAERRLSDGIMYAESLAALYGGFGLALSYRDPTTGAVVTPAQSRAELSMADPAGISEYLRRHHFHHICIGHTHNPHSQPYFTLENIEELAGPLASSIQEIRSKIPDLLEPTIKTTYFNSGTAGWMEGVIWAIEIDETGQARLAYWTDNSTGFEYMDWELQPLPDYVHNNRLQGVQNAFWGGAGEITDAIEDIIARLKVRLAEMNAPAEAYLNLLRQPAVLPITALAGALMESVGSIVRPLRQLEELGGTIEKKAEELDGQMERLRSFIFDVSLSVKRRGLQGFEDPADIDTFAILAPISPKAKRRLLQLQQVMEGLGNSAASALHYGGLAMSIFDGFPRNVPFFSSADQAISPIAATRGSPTPVLHAFLSTLWMYPPEGETIEVEEASISSKFEIDGNFVRLTVWLEPAARPMV